MCHNDAGCWPLTALRSVPVLRKLGRMGSEADDSDSDEHAVIEGGEG